jgi:hypothetical protein
MVVLLSATIISCSQALQIIDRLQKIVGLTPIQKSEILVEIKKVIPSCPVIVKTKNENTK